MTIYTIRNAHELASRVHPPVNGIEDWTRYVLSARGWPVRMPEGIAEDRPIPAEVYPHEVAGGGRWVARWLTVCDLEIVAGKTQPPRVCGGAGMADLIDRRAFCLQCYNASIGGRWRPVIAPDPMTLQVGEAILEARHPADAGWAPGQSLADLVAENLELGYPVPDVAVDLAAIADGA